MRWLVLAVLVSFSSSLVTLNLIHSRLSRLAMSDAAFGGEASAQDRCGPCPLAPKCSGEYREKGCDGDGKIQGGIATVLPWWPIKVFRPCPSYQAAGYVYKREGQTMDQVLFSEPSNKMQEKLKQDRLEELRKLEAQKAKITLQKEAEMMQAKGDKAATERIQAAEAVDKLLERKFGSTEEADGSN